MPYTLKWNGDVDGNPDWQGSIEFAWNDTDGCIWFKNHPESQRRALRLPTGIYRFRLWADDVIYQTVNVVHRDTPIDCIYWFYHTFEGRRITLRFSDGNSDTLPPFWGTNGMEPSKSRPKDPSLPSPYDLSDSRQRRIRGY